MDSKNWISAWCSLTGSSHISESLPCQDDSKVEYITDTNIIIAAVSDGAGSCANSKIGSNFLVDNVIEKIASFLKVNDLLIDTHKKLTSDMWKSESLQVF